MKNKDGIKIEVGQVWKISDSNKNWIEQVEWRVVGFHQCYVALGCESSEFVHHCVAGRLIELHKTHDGVDLEAARADGWEVYVEGMEIPDLDRVEERHVWYLTWVLPTPVDGNLDYWESDHTYRYKLKKEPVGYQAYKDAPDHQDKILPIETEEDYVSCNVDSMETPRLCCFRRLADAEAWLKEDEKPETSTKWCIKCSRAKAVRAEDLNKWDCTNCGWRHYAKDEKPKYKLFPIDWSSNCYPCLTQEGSGITFGIGLWLDVDGYRVFGFTDREDWPTRRPDMSMQESLAYSDFPCNRQSDRKYAIGRLI